jgi:hypothetical protein
MSANAETIYQERAFGLGRIPAWFWSGVGAYLLLLINGSRLLNDSDTYCSPNLRSYHCVGGSGAFGVSPACASPCACAAGDAGLGQRSRVGEREPPWTY